MQPYFSIVLPIYNVENYLKRCISAILSQDYQNYEIILVDDGSADSCPAICDQYSAAYDCIRTIHKPNGGLSSARNAGFQAARGKYIWWVDSDDWITDGALQKLYEGTVKTTPDIVKFDHYRVAETTEKITSNAPQGGYCADKDLHEQFRLACVSGGKYVLSAWSHLYRREWLTSTGVSFVSERIVGSEDYLFHLSVLPRAKSLLVLKDALYCYEKREGSLSQKYRPDLPKQYTELFRRLLEVSDEAACKSLFSSFYVWHLMCGTCMPHEYHRLTDRHTLQDGRKNVGALLRIPEIRYALKSMDRKSIGWKKQCQLTAMQFRLEPFFYWLYVLKPGRK